MANNSTAMLTKLGDHGFTVADPTEDIRGRTVVDVDGTKIGRIADLLIDTAERKVRLLRVEHGGILGFGVTATFIPVDAVGEIGATQVRIEKSGAHVAGSPPYDPELSEMDYYAGLYDYYGYLPFWGGGIVGPGLPPRT